MVLTVSRMAPSQIAPEPLYNTIFGVKIQIQTMLLYIESKMYRSNREMSISCLIRVQHWAMLYPKPCCNEPCHKEVEVYSKY